MFYVNIFTIGLLYTIPNNRNVPQEVLSAFANVLVWQGVQELAPSVLIVFPSQGKQDVSLAGK
jgi:hypothetical protein